MSFNSHSFNSSSFNAKAFTLAHVFAAAVGAYALTGTDADLLEGTVISAAVGTYTYTGEVAATSYLARVLDAEVGTYTITGEDALWQREFLASVGQYTYTGSDVTTSIAGTAAFNPSAFNVLAFSPIAFNLGPVDPKVIADVGVYNCVGTNAVTIETTQLVTMGAASGSYTYTGTDSFLIPGPGNIAVDFTVDFNLLNIKSPFAGNTAFEDIVAGDACAFNAFTTPDSLAVSMSGDGEFTVEFPVPAVQTFDYYIYDTSDGTRGTTEQITVLAFHDMPAGVGLYSIAGTDSVTIGTLKTDAEVGTYNLVGEAATFVSIGTVGLNANVGTYSFNGSVAATEWLGATLLAEVGTYALTEAGITIIQVRELEANVGYYNLFGTASTLRAPREYWFKDEPNPGPPEWSKAGGRSGVWTKEDEFSIGV